MIHPKHILIVDDDSATRTAVTLVLEGAGYRVTAAPNGREALDQLQSGLRPDLILLDLMMPVMDGWQFRKEQVEAPELASIPIIVLSATGMAAQQAETMQALDCLEKPIEFARLLETIRRHSPI